ncbi:DUF349 domain-containing protein [Corynebacterium anserum]|uniref:DUF349 domain-containing protein n=1 Tax=Corynebacterium anserum TaxID=2684406 RepID=A0A7G7YNQ3_9CORY|nr:DUF349 domain-containing protein [Corynebacterium anserum]MBC2681710.1 DUF349 domain-containing protein [Corynebacterium anserum]QNH96123.1 DUF349 domain-containing protein [Corynebacterium anserum]
MNSPTNHSSLPSASGSSTSVPTPNKVAMPKPGPKPSPRPNARVTGSVMAHRAVNDPSKFGRVDADGTAWVKTPTGERQIGEFKAGSPEEGLKHFGARYDDLATEVSMLEARLKSHPEEAKQVRADADNLRGSLATAAVIGDLQALDQQLQQVRAQCDTAEARVAHDKAERREKAIARKEALAEEAEKIGRESTDWKASGDRLRAILEEWKTIRGVDRATDDKLWKRYAAGRDEFSHRRGAFFSELDKNRASAKHKKEQLAEQAEALQNSTDWGATASKYRALMQEWKAAGRATRDADDRLWQRFRAAQDKFFDARKAANAKRDEEFEVNASAKQALLDEYDPKIDPSQGLDRARTQLRELQEKWEAIGFVPRARIREFDQKIAALEQRVSDAADAEWRRTNPETHARVAQFQAKVDQLASDAAAAEAKGNMKKATELRAQAAQWQEWADTAASAAAGE